MKAVCVYCGSSAGADGKYREAAHALGRTLVRHGLELVYGGARVGLMGELADAALASGGRVTGVIPEAFAPRVAHGGLTRLEITGGMHERKQRMFDLSDAFIALPGGFGTLEEMMELLTWGQLDFHRKPCGLLNVSGFYDPLLAFLDHAVREGFIKAAHRRMLFASEDAEALIRHFGSYAAPKTDKWYNRPIDS